MFCIPSFDEMTDLTPYLNHVIPAYAGIQTVSHSANQVEGTSETGSNGNSWSVVSDRALKENFVSIDPLDILDKLGEVPIDQWNLVSQDPSIRHMGPVAQDFYAAFGLGESNRHISTTDADGVALATIQGLYQVVQEKDVQIAAQEQADHLASAAALCPGGASHGAGASPNTGPANQGQSGGSIIGRRKREGHEAYFFPALRLGN